MTRLAIVLAATALVAVAWLTRSARGAPAAAAGRTEKQAAFSPPRGPAEAETPAAETPARASRPEEPAPPVAPRKDVAALRERLLVEPDPECRAAVLEEILALAEGGDPKALEAFREALCEHTDKSTRRKAAALLGGRLPPETAEGLIRKALRTEDCPSVLRAIDHSLSEILTRARGPQ